MSTPTPSLDPRTPYQWPLGWSMDSWLGKMVLKSPLYRFYSLDPRIEARLRELGHGQERAPLDSIDPITGRLDETGIAKQGSVAPRIVQGQFTYVSTDTQTTVYWDGTNGSIPFLLRRTDETNQAVPRGSLTMTGLQAGRTYTLLPFWPVHGCNVGFVVGEEGSPKFCHTTVTGLELALQQREDREPLSSSDVPLTITTNGSGVTTPGDPGVGGYDPGEGFDEDIGSGYARL